MPEFHKLQVADIRRETPDCVSIALHVPEQLQAAYQFVPGQYLTFKHQSNGEEIRRSYSICSALQEKELRVAVKQVENGQFSTFANHQLKVGDVLETMTPTGNFTASINETQQKKYVAFAAGSGITPILSILKTVLEQEPNSHFTLFYGNKNFDSIIFREEIEALKNVYLGRFSLYHVLSREMLNGPLFSGRIDAGKCQIFCEKLIDVQTIDAFFVCGPFSMITAVRDTLADMQINAEKVHFELFNTPDQVPKTTKKQEQPKATITDADAMVTVIKDGIAMEVPMHFEGTSILDAAMAQGADLPYSCKKGNCCTCRGKILEGESHLAINYALRDDELERGYTLTCQTFPRSKKVVISFDE